MPTDIRIKRVYDPADDDDGVRVLVDRVWPLGISKADAALDHWFKDLAPSTELRKWFGHDRERWAEFRRAYLEELEDKTEFLDELADMAGDAPLTLLYSARDEAHNQAVVLGEVLAKRLRKRRQGSPGATGGKSR